MTTESGHILVIEDKPDNWHFFAAILSARGYRVRQAPDGEAALNSAHTAPPDLILLDTNLAGRDGYEICQSLKADEAIQEIPIIFISALDGILDKVKAFRVGGVDYISKPFQAEEILARIENQLTIRRQQQKLQEEIQERQKAAAALRVYLHAVSHDLRNPVLGLSMVLHHLLKGQPLPSPGESGQETVAVPRSTLEQMASSCQRQLSLIESLVAIPAREVEGLPLQCQPLSLYRLSQSLAAEWEPRFAQEQVILENQISPDLPPVRADANQLWRVLDNLIANSIEHNFPGLELALKAEIISETMIRCTVADNGAGMEREEAEKLFAPYRRGQGARGTLGLGLGLYLCRQIIEAHGGKIGVITAPNKGAQFWFTLPIF